MPADTVTTKPLFDSPAQLLDIYDLMRLKRVRSRTTIYTMVKRKELPAPRDEDKVCGRPRWRLFDLLPSAKREPEAA